MEHLTTALKLNGSLFSKLEETKQFHAHILTLLGKCYMEAGNLKDALELLDKSLAMNKKILGEEHISNSSIYQVLAQVYQKMKEYPAAIDYLEKTRDLIHNTYGKDSEHSVDIYEQLARAY